jgi:hypothetical protein
MSATWEAEIGGLQVKVNLGKKLVRPYLKSGHGGVLCNPPARARRITVAG